MNFKDVMIAFGQLPYSDLGFECSGLVTNIGSNVEGIKIGDAVCGVTRGAFANTVRLPSYRVSKMPNGTDFEVGASLPLVFMTARYALDDVARLSQSESVLIHSAAGGIGQAAVMLAQNAGAEVFVTVGSLEKRDLVTKQYNIPEDHIFSSRDTTFEDGILRATNGAGVNVVLITLVGEAFRASWNCLAAFGRFIEIGKRDLAQNNYLEMSKFLESVSFASIDVGMVMDQRPKLFQTLMEDVFRMYQSGAIREVSPITTYSMSGIQDAMRLMYAGKHMGKVVIEARDSDMIQVSGFKASASAFTRRCSPNA